MFKRNRDCRSAKFKVQPVFTVWSSVWNIEKVCELCILIKRKSWKHFLLCFSFCQHFKFDISVLTLVYFLILWLNSRTDDNILDLKWIPVIFIFENVEIKVSRTFLLESEHLHKLTFRCASPFQWPWWWFTVNHLLNSRKLIFWEARGQCEVFTPIRQVKAHWRLQAGSCSECPQEWK